MSLFFTLLAAIVALGPVNHCGFPRWLEILLGLILVGVAQHYMLHRLFHASIMSPDLIPLPLLQMVLWGAAFLMAAGVCTLCLWGMMLFHIFVPQWIPLAVGIVGATWMIYFGERVPSVREYDVKIAALPRIAEGVRIAVIADLHIDHWRGSAWCDEVVKRINAAKPDIVVFTGDQVDGVLALRREGLAPLSKLEAPSGKYFITGNHEFYFDTEETIAYMESLGLTFLDGRSEVTRGLGFIGLPDGRSLTQSMHEEMLEDLVRGLPEGALPVLLVHKPGVASLADQLGIKLQLSGHTHGGQLPGVKYLISRFNRGLVNGWYTQVGGLQVFVSSGVGVWLGFPYRLYPSEIAILTLHRSS